MIILITIMLVQKYIMVNRDLNLSLFFLNDSLLNRCLICATIKNRIDLIKYSGDGNEEV